MTTLAIHTVFVACGNKDYLERLCYEFDRSEYYKLVGKTSDAKRLLEYITHDHPDILVVDPLIGGSDAIGFLGELHDKCMLYNTFVVVLTAMVNDEVIRAAQNFPFTKLIALPLMPRQVLDKLDRFVNNDVQPNNNMLVTDKLAVERAVSEYMLLLGIPPHLRGYNYLKCCILYCVERYSGGIVGMQSLYKDVASGLGVNVKNFERNMRHAIEVAWSRGSLYEQNSAFGNTLSASRGKPTNMEFIALLTEKAVTLASTRMS